MKVSVIPFIIDALGTVTKVLAQRLEDLETSGDFPKYDRPGYWEESWRLEGTCCHSDSNGKPSAIVPVKNFQIS